MSLITVEECLQLEVAEADYRFHYGDDPSQFGELFIPESAFLDDESLRPEPMIESDLSESATTHGEKLPVVVFLHGGCWSTKFNLEPVSGICRAIAENCGAAVWNLEYRRWENGGGWPHTFLDAANGLDLLEEMAEEFPLNLNNIVVCGHSAGGQLALWLAARPHLAKESPLSDQQPLPVKAVVALAPVNDLERAGEQGTCGHAVSQLMGGPSEKVSDQYKDGSPMALLPLGVRHVSISGMQDKVAPRKKVARYVAKARELGDDATFIPIDYTGHFELVVPDTRAGQLVMETIEHELIR